MLKALSSLTQLHTVNTSVTTAEALCPPCFGNFDTNHPALQVPNSLLIAVADASLDKHFALPAGKLSPCNRQRERIDPFTDMPVLLLMTADNHANMSACLLREV